MVGEAKVLVVMFARAMQRNASNRIETFAVPAHDLRDFISRTTAPRQVWLLAKLPALRTTSSADALMGAQVFPRLVRLGAGTAHELKRIRTFKTFQFKIIVKSALTSTEKQLAFPAFVIWYSKIFPLLN